MKQVVIDASVVIKLFVQESGTAQALALQQAARLIAPELLLAECSNII